MLNYEVTKWSMVLKSNFDCHLENGIHFGKQNKHLDWNRVFFFLRKQVGVNKTSKLIHCLWPEGVVEVRLRVVGLVSLKDKGVNTL